MFKIYKKAYTTVTNRAISKALYSQDIAKIKVIFDVILFVSLILILYILINIQQIEKFILISLSVRIASIISSVYILWKIGDWMFASKIWVITSVVIFLYHDLITGIGFSPIEFELFVLAVISSFVLLDIVWGVSIFTFVSIYIFIRIQIGYEIELLSSPFMSKEYFDQKSIAPILLFLFIVHILYVSAKHHSKAFSILTNRKAVYKKRYKNHKSSLNYAQRIQEAIFPRISQIKSVFKNGFILYLPKDVIAGDFYWLQEEGDEIYFAVGDCTGHGVPGAMVSVVCANALNRAVIEMKISQPSKILDKVRDLVTETFDRSGKEIKDGMDISFCRINLKTRKIVFAGANNSLYRITPLNGEILDGVISDDKNMLVEYKGNKQPIGKWTYETPFTQEEIILLEGDTLYLSSDGYMDQFGGEKGRKFMHRQFKNLILSINNKEVEEQKSILIKTFEKWKGEYDQVDDICVIGIHI